jgi:hypothetical protein
MRAIVGVQVVASGSVSVLGEAAGSASLRRQVGYVTQAPSVYADLSDEENLRFFASVVGAEHSRIPEVVEIVVSAATRTGSLARCREVSGRVVMFLITSIAMLRERTSGTLWALPLTYSYDALARATGPSALGSWFALDVLVTIACTIAALALGAATVERRTA